MAVEVVVPDEFVGDVHGDLNAAAAATSRASSRAATRRWSPREVPLAKMFGYVNELRSLTQGRATYTMQFLRYAQVPDSVRDKLVFH